MESLFMESTFMESPFPDFSTRCAMRTGTDIASKERVGMDCMGMTAWV